ncbi:MAG: hypothetical protein Q8907_04365 [Bacteroidota bacterium]|nr:hypothetical protein [Bacteroidota bacterium]
MKTSKNYKFSANSFYFEPGFNIVFSRDRISLELNIGYQKEFIRFDFEQIRGDDYTIQVKKKFADSDIWDGLRTGVTISYTLFKIGNKKSSTNKIGLNY